MDRPKPARTRDGYLTAITDDVLEKTWESFREEHQDVVDKWNALHRQRNSIDGMDSSEFELLYSDYQRPVFMYLTRTTIPFLIKKGILIPGVDYISELGPGDAKLMASFVSDFLFFYHEKLQYVYGWGQI